jgi:uncharacterized protein YcfJ
MNTIMRNALAVAGLAFATQAAAQITFYEREGFAGRSFTTQARVADFQSAGFNDRASSVTVARDRWEACEDAGFRGRCVILRPGNYASLAAMGLDNSISSVRAVDRNSRVDDNRYAPAPVTPQVTFYEREGFEGRSFTSERLVPNFERFGFNNTASSVVVVGANWEVCDGPGFRGRCMVLRPGRYPNLGAMGLNNQVSSVRAVSANMRVEETRYAPAPLIAADPGTRYRRRGEERLYEADVTAVRAVVGTPTQRCWVEKEQVQAPAPSTNKVPGAVIGGILGGILGHQVGSGRGQDVATVAGAVGGAVVGANVGSRTSSGTTTQTKDVQRCENVPGQAKADYWDVTYNFRGQEHRVQMSVPPGRTVTVNEQGEPRA